ncbi:uncharacterized protein LOC110686450 [Chenopodium quinoa]|uniref:uncharacterized protein LOC110686450 n=1 Tax=Chenopodium quinoa TaxID=63459 RepID=UPI000B7700B8|nr:uncharacterized protein LOC110686450 [Chenopodium quinoa]
MLYFFFFFVFCFNHATLRYGTYLLYHTHIFYLDRLNRDPVEWGVFPHIKVWNMNHIRNAAKDDRIIATGNFGNLGMLDVAYGEQHPLLARDSDGPVATNEYMEDVGGSRSVRNLKRRRARRRCKTLFARTSNKDGCPDANEGLSDIPFWKKYGSS